MDGEVTKKCRVETLFFPLQKIGGFIGKIDEIEVWNKLLSDKEISEQ